MTLLYTYTRKQMEIHLIGHSPSELLSKLREMLVEVHRTEITDPLKAARWLGYAIRLFEDITGTPNEVTRVWVRQDVRDCRSYSVSIQELVKDLTP